MIRRVGELQLLDMRILWEQHGADLLPYPLAITERSRFKSADEYEVYKSDVITRFREGELRWFERYLSLFLNHPDIRVEYYAHDLTNDIPIHRVSAVRSDQWACLVGQRTGEDIVAVFELSVEEIGPAIANMAGGIANAADHPRVQIEGFTTTNELPASDALQIRNSTSVDPQQFPLICQEEITAFGSVQSNYAPAREWGRDYSKELTRWVHTKRGSYIISRDGLLAEAMKPGALVARINALISDDAGRVRMQRSNLPGYSADL
ncbi:hypothetical protein NJBCHELONAE_05990 [Mycobacteroides chelonae]|nr:hypothetical protein NJBCHELONAE_05990 [Mycobacteroides chelonae]